MWYANLYHSPWHNPGLFVLANGLLIVFLLLRKTTTAEASFLRKSLIAMAILAIVDAALTGELAPFPEPIVPYVAIPFVILGDVRFFFLLERYAKQNGQSTPVAKLFFRSLLWGLIVPSTAYATKMSFFPERTNHWLFLTYESFFTVIALIFIGFVLPKWMNAWKITADQKRWLKTIALFELGFYALWVAADVIILFTGHEWGYLLRLAPNILYYAIFGWFVVLSAPKGIRP
jgi:hypothetical protein